MNKNGYLMDRQVKNTMELDSVLEGLTNSLNAIAEKAIPLYCSEWRDITTNRTLKVVEMYFAKSFSLELMVVLEDLSRENNWFKLILTGQTHPTISIPISSFIEQVKNKQLIPEKKSDQYLK